MMTETTQWIKLGKISKFDEGVTSIRKKRKNFAILKQDGQIVQVIQDNCPHNPRILISDDYLIENNMITCQFHGACFDLSDGSKVSGPGKSKVLLTYEFRISNTDNLEILLES